MKKALITSCYILLCLTGCTYLSNNTYVGVYYLDSCKSNLQNGCSYHILLNLNRNNKYELKVNNKIYNGSWDATETGDNQIIELTKNGVYQNDLYIGEVDGRVTLSVLNPQLITAAQDSVELLELTKK